MSDWLRQNDTLTTHDHEKHELNWKQRGYREANEMQRKIREELISPEDKERLVEKLGEYNANKFMESGIAGIPPEQTFDVKCIHAHVADHLSRVSFTTTTEQSALYTILNGESNVIGQRALQILHDKRVQVLGSGIEGRKYTAKKNRSGLKITRLRRKELKD